MALPFEPTGSGPNQNNWDLLARQFPLGVQHLGLIPSAFARDTSTTVDTGGATDTQATLDSSTWDGTVWDSDGTVDLANDKFVVQTPGAIIYVWCGIFAANATGQRFTAIYRNGTSERYVSANAVGGGFTTEMPPVVFPMRCAAGDEVTFHYWQNSGGDLTCSGDAFAIWLSH
jgi:hypothetical protein